MRVLKQRLSYPTETVLSSKNTRYRIVLSFIDSPRKPLGRHPNVSEQGSVAGLSDQAQKQSIQSNSREKLYVSIDV